MGQIISFQGESDTLVVSESENCVKFYSFGILLVQIDLNGSSLSMNY